MKHLYRLMLSCLIYTPFLAQAADDFEEDPIRYSASQPENRLSKLVGQIERGEASLGYDDKFGYLPALLKALDVPQSSQMLVFSKTSLQRARITPETPRALYFNDDVYIGYCHQGDVLEVSASDPKLGTVYYTVDQSQDDKPAIIRQTDNCLVCHATSQTQNVPGHTVRSVFADASGQLVLSAGSFRIDHTSPLEQRWGGWYVTGTHGEAKHLGNMVVTNRRDPEKQDNSANMNLQELDQRVRRDNYLTPHSDIVALMVLEHQAMAHNLIARANFTARQASHYQDALNRDLKMPADHEWDSTKTRIKSAGEPLVKCLLFSGEAPLKEQIVGTSGFAEEFTRQGPRDEQGRSLRDFDLKQRMFKYPCSYMIYSEAFDALPPLVANYIWKRLHEVLSGQDKSPDFSHLSEQDRAAILEILKATKKNLPEYFKT